MAELNSLAELGTAPIAPAEQEAPVHVQKLDAHGRAYATGKRKDAVARVWVKPGSGRIVINDKEFDKYFARPVLQMVLKQPIVATNRDGQRRRSFGSGGRRASRHLQGADLLRAGSPRRAQEGRLPDPRQPRGRAQEVRQGEGTPVLPVLQALSGNASLSIPGGGQSTLAALSIRDSGRVTSRGPAWHQPPSCDHLLAMRTFRK